MIDAKDLANELEDYDRTHLCDGKTRDLFGKIIIYLRSPQSNVLPATASFDATARTTAAWWRWRFLSQGSWSKWIGLNDDEISAFRDLQGDAMESGRVELQPLYLAAPQPTARPDRDGPLHKLIEVFEPIVREGRPVTGGRLSRSQKRYDNAKFIVDKVRAALATHQPNQRGEREGCPMIEGAACHDPACETDCQRSGGAPHQEGK